MGWFDGFPFKSREQQEKERKQFQSKVLPFGEPQKVAALTVLRQITGLKIHDDERLFAFFSAKDKYMEGLEENQALLVAYNAIKKQPRLTLEDRKNIVALIHLEHSITSLKEYPATQQVLLAAQEIGDLMDWD